MRIPANHPQRHQLNDEVHARPPGAIAHPARVSYIALRVPVGEQPHETALLNELAETHQHSGPADDATHYSADFGNYMLRWERHTEFSRIMIAAPATDDYFASSAFSLLPDNWLERLPGETMVAVHLALAGGHYLPADEQMLAERYFNGNMLIGSHITGGIATALTDLRINADGFSRILVYNGSMTPLQAGRAVQRLLEIETYRMMALLALPVARGLSPVLRRFESELATVTDTLITASDPDERQLLRQLMRLQAELENREAVNNFRFGAANAYHDVVLRRIAELREERLEGLQTFREFTERRLVPAMNTCQAIARRQESLSQRMARATQLLSTRVDIRRSRQNQELLQSMNRRSALQIRLQQTVEGLSVAAITYYVVSLVGYIAATEPLATLIKPKALTALSIPFVAVGVALAVRRARYLVTRDDGAD